MNPETALLNAAKQLVYIGEKLPNLVEYEAPFAHAMREMKAEIKKAEAL